MLKSLNIDMAVSNRYSFIIDCNEEKLEKLERFINNNCIDDLNDISRLLKRLNIDVKEKKNNKGYMEINRVRIKDI